MNDSTIPSRRATFRAAAKGMRAYSIALKLNAATRGYDFRGSTKRQLEDEFADGLLRNVSGQQLRDALTRVKK